NVMVDKSACIGTWGREAVDKSIRGFFFFFKQKTAYEFPSCLWAWEMLIKNGIFPPPPCIFQGLFSINILYISMCFCEFSIHFPVFMGISPKHIKKSAQFPGIPVMPVSFPQTANFAGAIKDPLPPPGEQKTHGPPFTADRVC
ncbi:hypothetical protein, partial [Faecalibacterium sp. Marseille-P9312]|uniref:hypothetical protein n=1 Tax=Faecalibacterium sp. Marseille-P9312 TaxID=2580425 RepID=UPI001A9B14FE